LTLAALQRRLAPDTAIAILNQLDDQLQVWIIRQRAVLTYSPVVSADRAATLVASHLHEMKRATATPVTSGELFDILLRPAAHALEGTRTIVVVADAPYHRVAFAGLWDRARNRYVVEDYALTMAPSATAFAWATARSQQYPSDGPRHAVVFEAPSGGSFPAAASRDHDHQLGAVYGSARLRRGETATPSRLLAGVSERNVVHVSAALMANDEFPVLSRLRLADEPGRKYSGSVLARRVGDEEVFRARLVVLETDVSQSTMPRAEGHLAFARAVLAAGVPNVVSPVAEVKTSDVGQIWLDFHRYYAGGPPAAASLRRAQLVALRESNHRPGPWALIAVFGSAQ
jgi:CHAT domain-containing protein